MNTAIRDFFTETEWDASPPLDEISLGWSQQCVKTLVPLRHLAEDRSKFPHHKDF